MYQINILYHLNLHNVMNQLYLNKAEEKQVKLYIEWFSSALLKL